MGGMRFTWTALGKFFEGMKGYKGKLYYVPCAVKDFREQVKCGPLCLPCRNFKEISKKKQEISFGPPLSYFEEISPENSNKIVFKDPTQWKELPDLDYGYFLLSNLKNLSSDTIAAPWAHSADGNIDLVYSEPMSRITLAKFLLGMEDGSYVNLDGVKYQKVKAVYFVPSMEEDKSDVETNSGLFMLDGEPSKPEPIGVECHPGLLKFFVSPPH
jgi:hypothetical protein